MNLLGFLAGKVTLGADPKSNRAWQPQIWAGDTERDEEMEAITDVASKREKN